MKSEITFTLADIEDAMQCQAGFCLECGGWTEGLEPDARKAPCDECGKRAAYGAEEIVLMGLVS